MNILQLNSALELLVWVELDSNDIFSLISQGRVNLFVNLLNGATVTLPSFDKQCTGVFEL